MKCHDDLTYGVLRTGNAAAAAAQKARMSSSENNVELMATRTIDSTFEPIVDENKNGMSQELFESVKNWYFCYL